MKLYPEPIKAFLVNDLSAYESEENDFTAIYQFKKGYVDVLGEFESKRYDSGQAYIIFSDDEVISVDKGLLRF
ncbi:MAG: hypothetical protein ACI35R_09310 [Bacillus sp. (in: firmicutes)]